MSVAVFSGSGQLVLEKMALPPVAAPAQPLQRTALNDPQYRVLAMPFQLHGVMTAPEYDKVLQNMTKDPLVTKEMLPAKEIPTSTKTSFDFPSGTSVVIEPELGQGGYTIDLNLAPTLKHGKSVSNITTAVTVWDKQTALLGGVTDVLDITEGEKPKHTAVIAITAQIVK